MGVHLYKYYFYLLTIFHVRTGRSSLPFKVASVTVKYSWVLFISSSASVLLLQFTYDLSIPTLTVNTTPCTLGHVVGRKDRLSAAEVWEKALCRRLPIEPVVSAADGTAGTSVSDKKYSCPVFSKMFLLFVPNASPVG